MSEVLKSKFLRVRDGTWIESLFEKGVEEADEGDDAES